VYVVGAELCTWKFADFQNSLQKHGVARSLTGKENVSCQLCCNVLCGVLLGVSIKTTRDNKQGIKVNI